MRISTNLMFTSGASRIMDLQAGVARTQEQISSGKRILTPADDPVAAAQALMTGQAKAANEQLALNRRDARHLLSTEESALGKVAGLLQDAKTKIIEAGNAALDDSQRKYIATELSGIFDQMLGLANSTDGTGNYIFAGYQSGQQPFSKSAAGASYAGDQGQRMLQVGAARQMAVSDSGTAVFELNKNGNGAFVTAAAGGNSGSAQISIGTVSNPSALTRNDYTLSFSVVGGVTTYSVVNTTTGTTLSTNNPYTSGEAIKLDGMQFEVSGNPADGDSFTVEPNDTPNQNIFTTLKDLIAVLNTPTSSPADRAALTRGLGYANGNITNALDNVLSVQASVGIRLKELDSLDDHGDSLDIQYQKELQDLQGLDYVKAITDLSQQKMMLDAAQQAFVKTSGLSLFNYLG
jgi:flagellar hook-associated protein 3 FlgL